MTSQTILFATAAIMTFGGLAILAIGKHRTPQEQLHSMCHGIVPLIAACSYFAMGTGQGAVILHNVDALGAIGPGRIFFYARYIDWAFTTPLLLLTLSLTAMHAGPKRAGLLLGVILADVMMIVTAFAFGASETQAAKWIWFVVSCAAFLGVYYVLFVPNMQANAGERADVRTSYREEAVILSVIWLVYPIVLAVSPDGAGVLGEAPSVLAIAVLDVVAKVVYGLLAVSHDAKATSLDLAGAPKARTGPVSAAA